MRGWSWESILIELKKCILLCKNCHAAYHAGLLKF
jgi:predicted HNH restriction endonuclease